MNVFIKLLIAIEKAEPNKLVRVIFEAIFVPILGSILRIFLTQDRSFEAYFMSVFKNPEALEAIFFATSLPPALAAAFIGANEIPKYGIASNIVSIIVPTIQLGKVKVLL